MIQSNECFHDKVAMQVNVETITDDIPSDLPWCQLIGVFSVGKAKRCMKHTFFFSSVGCNVSDDDWLKWWQKVKSIRLVLAKSTKVHATTVALPFKSIIGHLYEICRWGIVTLVALALFSAHFRGHWTGYARGTIFCKYLAHFPLRAQ